MQNLIDQIPVIHVTRYSYQSSMRIMKVSEDAFDNTKISEILEVSKS